MTSEFQDEDLKIINAGVIRGGDGYLFITRTKSALVEAGFSFTAGKMLENIKSELGDRPLDYILLTHSHYDHASGSYFVKKHYKDVKIVSSHYAAKILSKPSAVQVMREMNESAAEFYRCDAGEPMDAIDVDIPVSEGDAINLGGMTVKVLEAPGHTKCCLSYYIPEKKLLIACETAGCIAKPGLVAPAYLIGYEISLNYIRRIMGMDIERLLVPHQGIIEGREKCSEYINNALCSAEQLKDLIISDHRKGKTLEEITAHYESVFFSDELRRMQQPKAFYLNASYLIPMIIKECGNN